MKPETTYKITNPYRDEPNGRSVFDIPKCGQEKRREKRKIKAKLNKKYN